MPVIRARHDHGLLLGASARACPRHAVAALDGITGAHVDWTDSRGLNQWERTALELVRGTEQTRIRHQPYQGPRVTNGSTVQTERLWYPDRTTLVPLRGRGVTLSEMPGQPGRVITCQLGGCHG